MRIAPLRLSKRSAEPTDDPPLAWGGSGSALVNGDRTTTAAYPFGYRVASVESRARGRGAKAPKKTGNGRGDRIRTYDPWTPRPVRYQTAPRPDNIAGERPSRAPDCDQDKYPPRGRSLPSATIRDCRVGEAAPGWWLFFKVIRVPAPRPRHPRAFCLRNGVGGDCPRHRAGAASLQRGRPARSDVAFPRR